MGGQQCVIEFFGNVVKGKMFGCIGGLQELRKRLQVDLCIVDWCVIGFSGLIGNIYYVIGVIGCGKFDFKSLFCQVGILFKSMIVGIVVESGVFGQKNIVIVIGGGIICYWWKLQVGIWCGEYEKIIFGLIGKGIWGQWLGNQNINILGVGIIVFNFVYDG